MNANNPPIPDFPAFRQFLTEDIDWYRGIYPKFQPYADLSPVNLMIWLNIDNTLEVSQLDSTPVLRYVNPFAVNEQNYVLLAETANFEHITKILNQKNSTAYTATMNEQPLHLFSHLADHPQLILNPNRDSYEYILDINEQATLPGKPFSRQRRRIGFFERTHAEHDIQVAMIDTPEKSHKQLLLDLTKQWQLTANNTEAPTENREFDALTYAIETLNTFDRKVLIVTLDGRPIAFSIFTIFDDTAIIGHIKVDYATQYAFDYTTYSLAKQLQRRGITYMNFEQDLGIPGLRDHKMRLRPVRMLEKVDIAVRD